MENYVTPIEVVYLKDPILVQKIGPNAEVPYKENPVSVAYEVSLIGRADGRAEDNVGDVNYFHTNLRVCPPRGYYVELIPVPALERHGYMLSRNVQIIDPNDHEELMVSLYKFKEGDDIELPFRAVQMVLRKAEYSRLRLVGSVEDEAAAARHVVQEMRGGRNRGPNFGLSTTRPSRGGDADDGEIVFHNATATRGSGKSSGKGRPSNHMY